MTVQELLAVLWPITWDDYCCAIAVVIFGVAAVVLARDLVAARRPPRMDNP